MKLQDTTKLYGSKRDSSEQRRAFTSGQVPVAVYGLGKMGLPLAAVYADVSENTTGVDIDPDVVEAINDGDCPVGREPGLADLVSETVDSGALEATVDSAAAAAAASVHVVIVPTTLRENNEPDLSMLQAALEDIASGLESGDLVVVESTVPPRTSADVVQPLLAEQSGLDPDEFGVAFCPERTASGSALQDITQSYPKVVGGVDDESTRAAELIYEEITDNDVLPVSDAATAEAVKVFEGVYRDVNIALANELSRFADEMGVDVTEAIDVANTQPLCDIHLPGPGVGGHCIPYYPYFLIDQFATDTPLLRTAREVNDVMPEFTVGKLVQGLERNGTPIHDATVAVLGLAYRPGVAETRKSPAKPIAARLSAYDADVVGVDPVLDDVSDFELTPVSLSELSECDLDAVVIVTPHEEFDDIDWSAHDDLVVVDGRDMLEDGAISHAVYTIGAGWDVPKP
ncbi:nucleotide sugar dehydrogenase [Haloarculaceae archaeon H-GB2-1]|nr:nucleotide sugar dehydrogenase [Haloarculaceae archaeon H-GB1-1]MEA5389582.1 nucleotide sugar dehydrogenase [Haloarculaceae archaeon H-GB11]MEA5409965.1 nucleotide sugar dehydrogenase [Haloarculaceae archaeon H-GB2-1]